MTETADHAVYLPLILIALHSLLHTDFLVTASMRIPIHIQPRELSRHPSTNTLHASGLSASVISVPLNWGFIRVHVTVNIHFGVHFGCISPSATVSQRQMLSFLDFHGHF